MKNNLQNLGETLRTLRRERGFTQEQLAELADLHSTYIAKIEAGQRLPSLETLASLANALQIPMSMIISRVEDEARPDVFHDAICTKPPENLQQVKRELAYMVEDLNLKQGVFLRDMIKLIRAHIFE